MRAVALDVHRDFCEVAIVTEGRVRSAGRVAARPDVLEVFVSRVKVLRTPVSGVRGVASGNFRARSRSQRASRRRALLAG